MPRVISSPVACITFQAHGHFTRRLSCDAVEIRIIPTLINMQKPWQRSMNPPAVFQQGVGLQGIGRRPGAGKTGNGADYEKEGINEPEDDQIDNGGHSPSPESAVSTVLSWMFVSRHVEEFALFVLNDGQHGDGCRFRSQTCPPKLAGMNPRSFACSISSTANPPSGR